MEFSNEIMNVLSIALVNGFIQSTIVVLCVVGLFHLVDNLAAKMPEWSFIRPSPSTRYAIWFLTLVTVFGIHIYALGLTEKTNPDTVALTEGVSGSRVMADFSTTGSARAISQSPATAEPQRLFDAEQNVIPVTGWNFSPPAAFASPHDVSSAVSEVESGALNRSADSLVSEFRNNATIPVPAWAMTIVRIGIGLWLTVVSLLLIRLALSFYRLSGIKRRARILPDEIKYRLEKWTSDRSFLKHLKIAESEEISTPAAAGLFHPMILLPVGLREQMTPTELDQILLHEFAHLHRKDDWTNLFQRITESLLVHHPIAHFVSNKMSEERECACDDWVIARTEKPASYVSSLSRLVELRLHARGVSLAPGMASSRQNLFDRMKRVLNNENPPSSRFSRDQMIMAGTLVGMVAVLLAFTLPKIDFSWGTDTESDSGTLVVIESSMASIPPLPPLPPLPAVAPLPPLPPLAPLPLLPPLPPLPPLPAVAPLPPVPPRAPLAPLPPIPPLPPSPAVAPLLHTPPSAPISYEPAPPAAAEPRAYRKTFSPRSYLASEYSHELSVKSWIRLLKASESISSGAEKAQVLREASTRLPAETTVVSAYIDAASTITSSEDRRRALSALVIRNELDESSLLIVIDAASKLPSGNQRALLLIDITHHSPDVDSIREALIEAANKLPSESDRKRVLRAAGN